MTERMFKLAASIVIYGLFFMMLHGLFTSELFWRDVKRLRAGTVGFRAIIQEIIPPEMREENANLCIAGMGDERLRAVCEGGP